MNIEHLKGAFNGSPALGSTGNNGYNVIAALLAVRALPAHCMTDSGYRELWDNLYQGIVYRDLMQAATKVPLDLGQCLEYARKFQGYRVTRGLNMTHLVHGLSDPHRFITDYHTSDPLKSTEELGQTNSAKTTYVNGSVGLLRDVLIQNRQSLSTMLLGTGKRESIVDHIWNQFSELLYLKFGTVEPDWTEDAKLAAEQYVGRLYALSYEMRELRVTPCRDAIYELLHYGLGDDTDLAIIVDQLAETEAFNDRN